MIWQSGVCVATFGVLFSALLWIEARVNEPIFFFGVGLGIQSIAYIITIQSSIAWKERGVDKVNQLLSSAEAISSEERFLVISALNTGMRAVFLAAIVIATVCFLATFLFPKTVRSRENLSP